MSNNSDPEIDRNEVARILEVSVRHTYNLQKKGELSKGRKIQRRGDRRWLLSEIEALKARFDAELEEN